MKPSLKLHWTAIFKDGTEVSQIDELGNEHLYKEVQDRIDQLDKFYIVHVTEPFKALVDLSQGLIFINSQQATVSPELTKEKFNIRLIFFRRHTVQISNNIETGHNIIYFLGFQYNDKAGQNHKALIQVDQGGSIIAGVA
jgi:hypothetical protein